MRSVFMLPACFVFLLLHVSRVPTAFGDQKLAEQAFEVLKSHCYSCHGLEWEVPGFDVLHRPSLLAQRVDEPSFIVPGDLEKSHLWQRFAVDGDMPPKKIKDRPSAEEIETVRLWILAGAEFPLQQKRPHVPEQAVLKHIRDDLQNLSRSDRGQQRYLSLHAIANNPRFSESDLRLYRGAVVKLLNSVSRSSRLEFPPLIDAPANDPTSGFVFRIDLRKFGWTVADWMAVLADYPYGLAWNESGLQELNQDIEQLVGGAAAFDGVPYIRADWFVAKAARPASYHRLLNVPQTVEELESKLGVNMEGDFRQDRLRRAGFAGSGVSHQNRLIDRHEGSITSYYYRSYDFETNFGRSILFRFPLGPRFKNHPFDEHAFEHAGGEIIWSLPNGMQGYMLIEKDGKRIDIGPIQIVRDMREISGSPEIVNAVSCIGCHRNGLLDYKDAIAKTQALTADARAKVDSLFVKDQELEQILTADRDRYLAAQNQLLKPYLQIAEHANKPWNEFPEPVSTVAKWYEQDMTSIDVAAELGFDEPKALEGTIRLNQKLKDLGLGPVAIGSAIPRRMWETREESPASIFQRTAVALSLGRGVNPQ